MKTPKKYLDALNSNLITYEMLGISAFSCNKRAKNYRDKGREYKYRSRHYNKYDLYSYNAYQTMNEFYAKKEKLLSIVPPNSIHKVHLTFDYKDDEIVYFLNYDIYGYSFHSSKLTLEQLKQYNLPIKDIGTLNTYGKDCTELVSTQFVTKLIERIENGNYQLCYALPEDVLQIDYIEMMQLKQKYEEELKVRGLKQFVSAFTNRALHSENYLERLCCCYMINNISPSNYIPFRLDGIIVPPNITVKTVQNINTLYDNADAELRKYGILFPSGMTL